MTDDTGRSARKRRAIVDAATTVFLQKGYLGTSMDEIAARAAVSKQTVYKQFADKEHLFGEILLGTVDDITDLVDPALGDTEDLPKDLGELAHRFVASLMRPEVLRLRRLVIGEAGRFPELGRTWYERGFDRVIGALASTVERLAERGLIRVDDPTVAAHHFFGLILWIPVNRVMFCGEDERFTAAELDRIADDGVRVFLAAYTAAR